MKIKTNKKNIIKKTEKGTLIKIQETEYMFWHPSKLIDDTNGDIEIYIPETFKINIFKNRKENNRWVQKDKQQITKEELLEKGNYKQTGEKT